MSIPKPVINQANTLSPRRTSQIFFNLKLVVQIKQQAYIKKVRAMKLLTMNIYINAWLDCSHPFISIHNKFDDDLLVHFNAKSVNQLIEDGEVFLEDLQSTNPDIQMEIATSLIAIKSGETIKQQITEMSTTLKRREPAVAINKVTTSKKPKIQISNLFPSPLLQTV